jgi:hypothetical protein
MIKNSLYLLLFFAVSCREAASPKPAVYSTAEGAINGYDAVAYFIEGKPVKGFDSLSFTWNDAQWKFSSQSNLDSFRNNTSHFAPKYGGYCAYGLSRNYKAQTSPDAWSIVENQLYLNYNKEVQVEWKKDMDNRIAEADKNWPEISDR